MYSSASDYQVMCPLQGHFPKAQASQGSDDLGIRSFKNIPQFMRHPTR